MSVFLNAAYRVLSTYQRPMTPQQITAVALDSGLLPTNGRTPWRTMQSKMSVDVLKKGYRSRFMRTAPGYFALREWQTLETREYIAPRRQLIQPDEPLVVFPRSFLPHLVDKVGLTHRRIDTRAFLPHCFSMWRSDAELNSDVIQLVSVFIVHHDDRILTYRRTRRLPEQRLAGTYTVVFGGHLTVEDIGLPNPLFDPFDPDDGIYMEREFYEELQVSSRPTICYRGLLYDDAAAVSTQHLGIVFDVHLASPEYRIGERGSLADATFRTKSEIRSSISDYENWSIAIIKDEAAS